ncbi:phage portal protein family protein [Gordonia soli]|uniref:Portal protein n=1 Tax=Gordonia soli NBRC 108243 TaxID=1223545 RepID=M0QR33_9ACTN|nr:DUF935 family protein [Gordonia soli]GAC70736.1 hypothetical protein GS4_39_00670 [Gordonia soli NBRC 108243]
MTERQRTAAPRSESGYVNGMGLDWQQFDPDEQVPELQWPRSTHVYRNMTRGDARVASVLQAIGLPIRRTTWRIDPNGAPDEVVEFVSKDLGLPILGQDAEPSATRSRGRFSWAQHLQTALLMLQYGHSYFEQVYFPPDDSGYMHLRKLAARPQRTITKIKVALDGGLVSIIQAPPAGTTPLVYAPTEVEVKVNRLVAYVRDPEPGEWIGSSLLRPAYKHWLLKNQLMRTEAAAAYRNSMGIPVGTARNSDDPTEVDQMQQIATEYIAGMNSGVGLAAGQSLELLAPQGNLVDPRPAIDWHDKQIALAGLAHFLNLDGKGGSYALASVQSDTFAQSVQTFAETVRDTANAHIVEDLIDINFGTDVPAPRIVFDEIGSRQDATAAALKLLVDAGLLSPDVLLERTLRQNLGLPAPDESTQSEPPTPPAPAARGRRTARASADQPTLFD